MAEREAAFSQSHEGCECQLILTPLGSICKAKCPRHSVHFLKQIYFFLEHLLDVIFTALCLFLKTTTASVIDSTVGEKKEVQRSLVSVCVRPCGSKVWSNVRC